MTAKPRPRRGTIRKPPPNLTKAAVSGASANSQPLPSHKHERFAELVASGRNVTAAYLELYPGKTEAVACAAGSRLLSKVNVAARAAYLSSILGKQALSAAAVTKERVLTELARVGYANMQDFTSADDRGRVRLDLSSLTREQWAAVSELTVKTVGAVGDAVGDAPIIETKLKLHSKLPALEQLGKHLKLYTDVVEHIEPEGLPERRQAARQMMMRMLDLRAQGKLPPEMAAILDEWAGSAAPAKPAIEAKAVEVKR